MKQNFEHELEARIDRALKRLPDLPAPRSLAPRVLQAIARQEALPWYYRPWHSWPATLQVICMLVLVTSFGGFSYAAWQLTQAAGYQAAWEEVRELFSGFAFVGSICKALVGVLWLVIRQLGTPFAIGCIAAAGMLYGTLIGLGTLYVRVAFALRRNS